MITIYTLIQAPVDEVWSRWTEPVHIEQWNYAGDDWHCPKAMVDLRTGGRFTYTMAARDGSFQFEFGGVYESVDPLVRIDVCLDDGRRWITQFDSVPEGTSVTESFDPEQVNPEEMQRMGWQMILDRFRRYVLHHA